MDVFIIIIIFFLLLTYVKSAGYSCINTKTNEYMSKKRLKITNCSTKAQRNYTVLFQNDTNLLNMIPPQQDWQGDPIKSYLF